jgi:hypothetical protein
VLAVKFVNLHAAQRRIGQHFQHIDEVGAVLDPQSRAELLRHQPGDGLRTDALGELLRRRADELAEDEGQHGKEYADRAQCSRHARNGNARDAHDRIFGIADKLRQREQCAD